MTPAIRVENLSKRYRLGLTHARSLNELASRWTRRMRGLPPVEHPVDLADGRPATTGEFWALKDVSFEVEPGQVVGIVGRNGAGKSTLLKILSRITRPSTGRIELAGRVGSLLEVGTGFHPEMTGRENVYMNGTLLGMSKREVARKFDEIVEFAGVERFIDTPIKRYSSGMKVRLGFAVAAHLEPEILVVDEVLAVGDAAFQSKCLSAMQDVARGGRTVLFVSHNMAAVSKLCDRCILLGAGRVEADSDATSIVRKYLSAAVRSGRFSNIGRRSKPVGVRIENAWIEKDGHSTGTLFYGDTATLVVDFEALSDVTFSIELVFRQADGVPVACAPSGLAHGWEVAAVPGRRRILARLPKLELAAGPYTIDVAAAEAKFRFYDYIESAIGFDIAESLVGPHSWNFHQRNAQGCMLWHVDFSESECPAPDDSNERKAVQIH